MSSDTIQLKEVTDKSLFFWLKKAKDNGLDAFQAACLTYDYEPPTQAVPLYNFPLPIQELVDKITKNYPHEYEIKHDFIYEYRYSFNTIKQAINDEGLSFVKLLEFEIRQNKLRIDKNENKEKKLDPRERKTLYIIIASLCEKQGITPNKTGLASELSKISDKLGNSRSEDAIYAALEKVMEEIK